MAECEECGSSYQAKSARHRFCRTSCRVAANRRPDKRGRHAAANSAAAKPTPYVHVVGALLSATAAELQRLEQLDSVNGRAALAMAARIESPMETGSAAATMTKQLVDLMALAAAAAAPRQRDGVSSLEESASAKLRLVR